MPSFLSDGGPMMWLLLATSAVALAIFINRVLQYHREQINTTEFLNGVRNVLKRDNAVEALAICDATPGPVARLVKVAILNRDRGREGVRAALEDAGAWEVPRLEQKLNVLATIAQIAPLMGLLGTVLGFITVFKDLQDAGLTAHVGQLSRGIGADCFARRRDWRCPFPVMLDIIIWSDASTPSSSTWNKFPPKFLTW